MLQPADRRVCHVGEDVGEPGLRVDVIELGRHDQRGHEGGAISTTIRAGEEPRFPAVCEASERAFGGIVRQANPAIIQERHEAIPSLEHVIYRLGDGRTARQFCPPGLEPMMQFFGEWLAIFAAALQALGGGKTVDLSFDIERKRQVEAVQAS